MKKQLRRVLAVVCALAFAVTGITFTPAPVNAGSSWLGANIPSGKWAKGTEYTLGDIDDSDGGGLWSFLPNNNEWGNYVAKYRNAEKIESFEFNSTNYNNNGGVFLRLKNMFDLGIKDTKNRDIVSGVKYNVTVSMRYYEVGDSGTGSMKHFLQFYDDNTNVYQTITKTVQGKNGGAYTDVPFEFQFTPKKADGLNFLLAWSNKYDDGGGDYSERGHFMVNSIVFTPADDFLPCDTNTDYHPGSNDNPWTVNVAYNPVPETGTWGAMSYKVGGDPTDVTSTYLRADEPVHDDTNKKLKTDALKDKKRNQHPDMSDAEFEAWWNNYNALEDADAWWWWNSAKLADYMTSLKWGYRYKPTLKVKYTRPDGADYGSPQLRVIFNGEVILKEMKESGEYTIKLCSNDGFVYTGQYNNIEFNYDLLDKGGIIQVSELTFEKDPNFAPCTPNVEGGFNPAGTPWYYSIQNDTKTAQKPSLFGMTSYYVSGTDTSEIGSTQTRVDTPAHDDNNEILKSDALKSKKLAQKKAEKPDITDAEFEEFWASYDATADPDAWWWWNSMKLKGYMSDLTENKKYTGELTYTYTAPTDPDESYSPKLRMIYGGNSEVIDISEGTHTVNFAANGFTYDGEHSNVEFNLDVLEEAGVIQITNIKFNGDAFNPVTPKDPTDPDDKGFNPKSKDGTVSTPWLISVLNNKDTTWGQISYAVDDNHAAEVGGTTMRNDNPAHDDETKDLITEDLINKKHDIYPDKDEAWWTEYWDNYDPQQDPDAWWWWNSAKLPNYMTEKATAKVGGVDKPLEDGKTYSGKINVKYTESTNPEDDYNAKLRIIINGEVHVVDLHDGDNEINLDAFDFSDSYPDIEFNLDLLGKNSTFQVTDITFALENSDWTRVQDNTNPGALIPVRYKKVVPDVDKTIHTWNMFAGIWGGKGCKLYYKNDLENLDDPLAIKIGDGERWDPACAQLKLSNEDIYNGLKPFTNYYLTYTFNSTEDGTVHINQEGYAEDESKAVERVDVHKGKNVIRKIFTYVPEFNEGKNFTMFLTPTTWKWNEQTQDTDIVMDGDYLPKGTILSDFEVSFARTDEFGYTLVTDCRWESQQAQRYDHIVKDANDNPILSAYSNSWFKGRMSYKAGENPDGENDIAKMGIRLDMTAYGENPFYEFGNNDWGNHLRIPNSYFYGDRRAGKDISNVGVDTNGNKLQSGRKYKLRFYYNSTKATLQDEDHGLIMVRQGYDSNQWFTYPTVEGLNMCNGTITKYEKNGDPAVADDEDHTPYISHGDTDTYGYTKTGGIDFYYNDQMRRDDMFVQFDFSYFPEQTYIDDISWEFYAPGYNVYIDNVKNNTQPITEDPDQNTYTFPSNDVQGFENVVRYEDVNNPQKTYRPGQTITFDDFNDADIYVKAIRQHKVEIRAGSTTGTLLQTDYVYHNDNYTLPTITGVVDYTYNGTNYNAGDPIGPITQDEIVVANMPNAHIIRYVAEDDPDHVYDTDTATHGSMYTLHDLQGVEVDHYIYNGQNKGVTDEIGPINADTDVIVVLKPKTHTVKYVNKDDHSIEYLTDTATEGVNYPVKEVTSVNVDKYYYEGQEVTPNTNLGNITSDIYIEVTLKPVTHTVKYVNKFDDTIEYASFPVDHGEMHTLVSLTGVNVDHYEYGNQTNLHAGTPIGPINDDATVYVVPVVVTHNVKYVDKDDHTFVYQTDTVPEGQTVTLPNTVNGLPAEDLVKYIYDNVDKYPGNIIGPFDTDVEVEVVKVPYYKITIDGKPYETVRDGGNSTLPESTGVYEGVIGYIYDRGPQQTDTELILDPKTVVGPIHEDRNYISIKSITVTAQQGASMWFKEGENQRGIGFGAQFTIFDKDGNEVSRYEHPSVYKSESFKLGTMITTWDIYTEYFGGEPLTLADVKRAQDEGHADYITNIMNDYTFADEPDPTKNIATYRAGIIHMPDHNITRDFTARSYGYIQTKSGAVSDVVYGDMARKTNIKRIATIIRNTPEEWNKAKYQGDKNKYKRDVIEYCINYEG
ncbi:MAG: hypothetical protein K6E58_00645 [Eubacterium sp.]|nr:hypothetical protein [Eubacterium sp.]